jgi:hypothetical protein
MNVPCQPPSRIRDRRPGRILGTAIAVALCFGTTACGDTPFGDDDADRAQAPGLRAQAKPTVKSVRAFYARASDAYRTKDAHRLCTMMQPRYAAAMVRQAANAGLDASTCREMWQVVFRADPDGYKDKISRVSVKGRTATFVSGDDPWRLRFVHGKWLIVDPG